MAGKMKRDLEDYVPVSVRVEQFRQDNPEGLIVTERSDIGEDIVAFKAKVFRSLDEAMKLGPLDLCAATGHAELEVTDEKVVEKCETVAIGRALAVLGYEIKKGIASSDEMDDYEESKSRKKRRSSRKDEDESGLRSRKRSRDEEPEEEDEDEEQEERPRSRSRSDREDRGKSRKRRAREPEPEDEDEYEDEEGSEEEEEQKESTSKRSARGRSSGRSDRKRFR